MARHIDNIPIFNEDTLYAKNGQNARVIFETRKFYKGYAYPTGSDMPGVMDFWYEQPLFGKLNNDGDIICLSETNLKQLNSEENTVFAIDFVVDAYKDFAEAHKLALMRNKLRKSGPYIDVEPKVAWQSPTKLHHDHMEKIYKFFVSGPLQSSRISNKIISFGDFVKVFLRFLRFLPNLPITRTAFVKSRFCAPVVSGLIIEIKQQDHGSDEQKRVDYVEDENFEYFRKLARQHGFLLDKNAPWRLVANINTKPMKKYMKEYGLEDNNDVFDIYYYRTHFQDLDILKTYMMHFYNSYITAYPYATQVKLEKLDESTSLFKKARRKPITKSNFKQQYGDLFWLKTYCQIRLFETNSNWDDDKIEGEIKKTIQLYLALDMEKALDYINKRTKKR